MTDQEQDTTLTYDEELEPGYYVQIVSHFWRNPDYTLEEKGLYTLLLTYCGKGESSFPGQDRLAKELGISENPLRVAMRGLETKGLLRVKRRGQGKTNVYHVHKFKLRTSENEVQEPREKSFKKPTSKGSRTSQNEAELYKEELYSENKNKNIHTRTATGVCVSEDVRNGVTNIYKRLWPTDTGRSHLEEAYYMAAEFGLKEYEYAAQVCKSKYPNGVCMKADFTLGVLRRRQEQKQPVQFQEYQQTKAASVQPPDQRYRMLLGMKKRGLWSAEYEQELQELVKNNPELVAAATGTGR